MVVCGQSNKKLEIPNDDLRIACVLSNLECITYTNNAFASFT